MSLRPPPAHAPDRLRSTADLRRLQRLMTHAIVRPLAPGDRTPRDWVDGRPTAEVIGEFIKPNDRLGSVERIQIYQRMYWYRLIGSATEDCPGLAALLGPRKFGRMIREYLARCPSRSFTLRDLCSRLPEFLEAEPRWAAPRSAAALALARYEWAQTVAFDGPSRPRLSLAAIRRTPPERLRVDLQPYLSLLDLPYPVDAYVRAVRRREALRGEASNAVDGPGRRRVRRVAPPARERVRLVVHRLDQRVFYKRVGPAEFRVLAALRAGLPVAKAVTEAGRVRPETVQEWFATWMRLGWLCARRQATNGWSLQSKGTAKRVSPARPKRLPGSGPATGRGLERIEGGALPPGEGTLNP